MLSIKLLGQPRIELNESLLTVRRRKSRALVYYLAAHTHPRTREHLLGMFWPDLDRAAAQQSLRTTLHELRKVLGEWLVVDNDQLGLSPAAAVDVHTFEQKLSPPVTDPDELRATLALYRGEFLTGFGLDAAPEFDDWLMAQAERYRRLAVRGLATLAALLESQHDYAAALDALDRALQFDPLQEDLQRAALRVHYLAGDRTGAIRRYDRLRKLLDDEMAIPPMAETRLLYDAILNDTVEPQGPPLSAAGGTRPAGTGERPALYRARPGIERPADAVHNHTPQTRVDRRRARHRENAAGARIHRAGECPGPDRERARTRTPAPLPAGDRSPAQPAGRAVVGAAAGRGDRADAQSLAGRSRAPAAGTGAETRSRTAPDEARLWEGISQFLQTLAAHQPVIVFLDDLHWADSSTLALLGYLIRQTARAAVMFIVTARSDAKHSPLTTLLQALTRSGQLERIPLARLSAPDVERVAQHLSSDFAYPLADWLSRVSEGNPYVLAELVRHAREHDILRANGVVDLNQLTASPVVPQSIYSLIQGRLAHLSDPARRMLDAAVAIGREFEVEVAYRAAGLSESAALDALDELQAVGIIQPRGETVYGFDHHLTMEVAQHEVGELRHRILHRRVAEALETRAGRHREDTAAVDRFSFCGRERARTRRPVCLARRAAGRATGRLDGSHPIF